MLRSTMIAMLSAGCLMLGLSSFTGTILASDSLTDTLAQKPKIFYQFLRDNQPVAANWKTTGLSLKEFPAVLKLEAKALDPQSDNGNQYQVNDFIVYLVNGKRPVLTVRSQSGEISMKALQDAAKEANSTSLRMVVEVKEVMRIAANGQKAVTEINGSPIVSVKIME